MAEKSRYWSATRGFNIIVKIGKIDLTPDLIEFTIITSINLPYQTFQLKIAVDSNDMITNKIYGQTPIKLTVNLLDTSEYVTESTEFELMYLTSDMSINQSMESPGSMQKDRSVITINTVARSAYKTMNTHVNNIYTGGTVKTAIDGLIKTAGATAKYDANGQNPEKIDQILVPPSTLYKNLNYINRTFGIFDGLPCIYCDYNNIVHIKNLTNKMKQAQALTIYQLALDDKDSNKIFEKCNDGIHYYTVHELVTKYTGNSILATIAPKMIYVVKPSDRLEQKIVIKTEDFTKKYGLISKSDNIFFDKHAITSDSRIAIHKDHTGYERTQTFINANVSKKISFITDMLVAVNHSIKILNLMNIGESVEIISKTTSTEEISGRYMLKTSEIKFNRAKDWGTTATLHLIRSNRTLT